MPNLHTTTREAVRRRPGIPSVVAMREVREWMRCGGMPMTVAPQWYWGLAPVGTSFAALEWARLSTAILPIRLIHLSVRARCEGIRRRLPPVASTPTSLQTELARRVGPPSSCTAATTARAADIVEATTVLLGLIVSDSCNESNKCDTEVIFVYKYYFCTTNAMRLLL